MLEPNTSEIISKIADIQLEALHKLKDNPTIIAEDHLMKLLEVKDQEIEEAIDRHIQIYEDLKQAPELLKLLTEYQVSLCSYILWKMESEWVNLNQEGVLGAWALIINAQLKFHPEYLSLSQI